MRNLKVSGGTNTITVNEYPTQQELRLETIDQPVTAKFTASEKAYLENRARERGLGLSRMLREMIRHYIEIEPKLLALHEILDDIFD